MSVKNLFRMESETVTEQPIKIPFSFDSKENIPAGKNIGDSIVIRPITVGTWFKLRPLLMRIDSDDLNNMVAKQGEVATDFVGYFDKYGEVLTDIICIGIHNKPTEPPSWFRQVLIDNSTWEDIRILLNAIVYRIGYYPFYNAITTAQRVSPISETEIIAAQKNIDSYKTSAKEDSL